MLCAIELLAIKNKATEEERIKREKEKLLRKQERIKRTIKWCETEVAQELLKSAKNGLSSNIVIYYKIRLIDDDIIEILQKYVSRRGNIYYAADSNHVLDFNALRSYLNNHCLEISYISDAIPCWNGGYFREGYELKIKVPLN